MIIYQYPFLKIRRPIVEEMQKCILFENENHFLFIDYLHNTLSAENNNKYSIFKIWHVQIDVTNDISDVINDGFEEVGISVTISDVTNSDVINSDATNAAFETNDVPDNVDEDDMITNINNCWWST